MTIYVCFYCHGHVYEADGKGCPQCNRKISTDPVDKVIGREWRGNPETLDELFDNLTFESDELKARSDVPLASGGGRGQ